MNEIMAFVKKKRILEYFDTPDDEGCAVLGDTSESRINDIVMLLSRLRRHGVFLVQLCAENRI